MKACIISIGDELLIGQVVNSNAAFIAEHLNTVGIEVRRVLTVGDDEGEIVSAFTEVYPRFDVIVVTGGLGPTHDDVTKKAVCSFFQTRLVPNAQVRADIERLLRARNLTWSAAAEDQTLFPDAASVIPNKLGTAPGHLIERERKFFIVMPGVPYEMEAMVREYVIPLFRERNTGKTVLHRTLNTAGIVESALARLIGSVEEVVRDGTLAFLPSPSGVRLRISVVASRRITAEQNLAAIESRLREKVGAYIFGIDDESLELSLGRILRERNLTISVAESCTGGLIGHKLTNIPGSSDYFERAVVAYSNRSKTEILNVSDDLIRAHGAVSEEVAKAMAAGIRSISGSDIGISTTGIAGPTGGTREKPVGLVWIGYSDAHVTFARKFYFGEDRGRTKERAAQSALDLTRRILLRLEEES